MWNVRKLLGAGAALVGIARAACGGDLVIDNYAGYSGHMNSLGSWTGDDDSMESISTTGTTINLTPETDGSSYFYTTFPCLAATTEGYDAITFPFRGPAGSSVTLEVQTSASCSATAYSSHYFEISELTGALQTVTVPLSSFTGANLDAITSWVWSSFSKDDDYELGRTSFVCASGGSSKSTGVSSSTASSVSSSSTNVDTLSELKIRDTVLSCPTLLIDDWESQSRLTFLYYNAMLQPSSDDLTMTSIVVSNNRVTLTPNDNSYFYSSFDCISATNTYGGISLRIKAPAGTSFTVQLQTSAQCSPDNFVAYDSTTDQLDWTFDGTEKLYSIPFTSFTGLDAGHLVAIMFYAFSGSVQLGPMAFYCGSTVSEYMVPPTTTTTNAAQTSTVPVTSATATAFVIDRFANADSNALGFWHGGDDATALSYSNGRLSISFTDTDYAFYTQVSDSCVDMTTYENAYIHIAYTGSNLFTIALQQHNSQCLDTIAPYPETWDVVEASRYATATDIYVPLSHFNINQSRLIGLALKAFLSTTPTVLSLIEIVSTVPSGVTIPAKIPTAPLVFACTRPNSFAFAIDDGNPEYAQQVMGIIKDEGIKVTFFTVGAPLLDASTNLSAVYGEMYAAGHQIALHSFTHPKMEALPTLADVDWEYQNDIDAVQKTLGISSKYFRPPFGNEGARMRQELASKIPGSQTINWSIDVEDWLWALSSTPEKQLEAFQRDLAKGGNLVVMHYLYPTTVGYLKQFIQLAKATGKQLMRVDQCLEDPEAPPL
ncbi:hypothetical protein RUND412_005714 [Rhizina undulata]